ncbi:4-hydroxy-2-oxoheptanedioate aldolase [Paenibacillus sp. JGP012]|uniref:HpcH/HpaI aldolase family protein n=1 Tax=Paenibacillus sp. JGP012 TaxID=2735914 RepID=UPI0016080A59|nr:aldolase/citrate lyase family protein [Paenibacillus sp. JGP012]MBB6022952.1 4-hydroxy-2-oxoheptanedioate aldolase [Paenibacillus sp. JGP012]
MRANTLKQKIARKQEVFGLFVSIPHPIIIEMIGQAAYDFVIIDLEHTTTSMESVEELIRAAELAELTPLVRISKVERTEILKVLDCGAQGIVIPHVETLAQVKEAVHHAYYHPLGMRSLNSGRPGVFGKFPLTDYIVEANEQVMIVPMIESVKGVRQSPEILSHPQVSFVLEGAADLSQSLGVPWQTDHPEVQDALRTLRDTAQQCDVPYATVTRGIKDMQVWCERDVHIYVLGDDRNTAFRAYAQKRNDYRNAGGLT